MIEHRTTLRRIAVAAIAVVAGSGCFMGSAAPSVPEGATRIVSNDVRGASWNCEEGEEIILVSSSPPALHVSSIDARITNAWVGPDGTHFFATFTGSDFGQTWIQTEGSNLKLGVEYVVPADPNADAVVARYVSIGGHGPITPPPAGVRMPTMRKFEGSKSGNGAKIPDGDPWSREVCWSANGPLAHAAKETGKSVHELQLAGAKPYGGEPLPSGPHGHALCTANVENITNWGNGVVTSTEGFVRPPHYAKVFFDLTSQPRKAYLLGNDKRGVVVDEYPNKDPKHTSPIFYFERGATGYLAIYVPPKAGQKDAAMALTVFAPGDLVNDQLPPTKKELAGPIMSWPFNDKNELVAAAIFCAIDEDK